MNHPAENRPAEHAPSLLHPLNELNTEGCKVMGKKARVVDIGARKRIKAADYRRWYVYVLSGEVVVRKGDHSQEDVTAGSPRAHHPLFEDASAAAHAVTKTPCKIIAFERQLYETLRQADSADGFEVHDVQVSEDESELFQQLYLACSNKELHLPSMPEVARKIGQMANDPEVGIPELTAVIQTEPIVAGSMLKVANSALYKGAVPVDNIKTAVTRLGLKATRDLAVAAALREAFRVNNPVIMKRMKTLWEHSVNISSFSYVIAGMTDGMDPEKALTGGLLHDIGVVAILAHLDQSGATPEMAEIESTIHKLRAMAGGLVSSHWNLGAEIQAIIDHAEDWRHDSRSDSSYCDVVILAHLCEQATQGPATAEAPTITEVPAARNLGLSMEDEDWAGQIIERGEREIAGIRQMLNS